MRACVATSPDTGPAGGFRIGNLMAAGGYHNDFVRCGAQASDTEDVVNTLLQIAGTQAAVILVEQPTGGFKISFRSRCELDCNKLASQFGGGGHQCASGCAVDGPLADAVRQVLSLLRGGPSVQ